MKALVAAFETDDAWENVLYLLKQQYAECCEVGIPTLRRAGTLALNGNAFRRDSA